MDRAHNISIYHPGRIQLRIYYHTDAQLPVTITQIHALYIILSVVVPVRWIPYGSLGTGIRYWAEMIEFRLGKYRKYIDDNARYNILTRGVNSNYRKKKIRQTFILLYARALQ